MVNVLSKEEIPKFIEDVFSTDVDLYENRQHGEEKTLGGLVRFTMDSLYDGHGDVQVYSYGDDYGFIAVDKSMGVIRSFGIKKQHRDKKDLFWKSAKEVLGDTFFACVWKDNKNAIRFFENYGGVKYNDNGEGVAYKFNME